MGPSGVLGGIYRICEWIMKLAYLNILWIFFTLLGVIIFGFFPAIAAMFSVTRRWATGEYDIPVFAIFWKTYKTEFFRSNFLGAFLVVIGLVLFVDFKYFTVQTGFVFQVLSLLVFTVGFLYMSTILYIFPVFAHYDLGLFHCFKNSVLIAMTHPVRTVTMILVSAGLMFILLYFTQFLLFFGGSVLSFLLMTSAYQAFSRIEKMKAKSEDVDLSILKI